MQLDDLHITSGLKHLCALAQRMDNVPPNVVIIVGTGVSRQVTGKAHALWHGLLEHGIDFMAKDEEYITAKRAVKLKQDLLVAFDPKKEFNLTIALNHADRIEREFRDLEGGAAFKHWLRKAFAEDFMPLSTRDALAPLDALRSLHASGAIIATTNYDDLIADQLGLTPVTWEQHAEVNQIVNRTKRDAVLHLHGHWKQDTSLVLGKESYGRVTHDKDFQFLFKALWQANTWVYAGIGAGLNDQNFGGLLRWARRWDRKGALDDYYIAEEKRAKWWRAHKEKPKSHKVIGLKKREDLAEVLHFIAPTGRSGPFSVVDKDFRLFGEKGADNVFPTREAFIKGQVPVLAIDKELSERIAKTGWASIIAGPAIGKTTVALKLACSKQFRDGICYHLDLAESFETGVSAPENILPRLIRPGVLFIIDNAHHNPHKARDIWSKWKRNRLGSSMLLIFSRRHLDKATERNAHILHFWNVESNTPIGYSLTEDDLAQIAHFHIMQADRRKTKRSFHIPSSASKAWVADDYHVALNAFVFAVKGSIEAFKKDDWSLPIERASQWVWDHWLDDMAVEERENLAVLAAFGAQEMEMSVNELAMPFIGKWEYSKEIRLIHESTKGWAVVHKHISLLEPGWGRFILEALNRVYALQEFGRKYDAADLRVQVASTTPAMLMSLHSRLWERSQAAEKRALWLKADEHRNTLVQSSLKLPLTFISALLLKASGQAKGPNGDDIAQRFLEELAQYPDALLQAAWRGTLEHISSFLVKIKGKATCQGIDLAQFIWEHLEVEPRRLLDTSWNSSLADISVFLVEAQGKAPDMDSNTDLSQRLWAELAKHPDELLNTAWNGSLDYIGLFMDKAKGQAKDEKGPDLAHRLWSELAKHPDMLLETAWKGSLHSISTFLVKAEGKATYRGMDLAHYLWGQLEKEPKRLLETAWNSSLADISTFLDKARDKKQVKGSDLADRIWKKLSANEDKLIERAWAGSLSAISTFMVKARNKEIIKGVDLADRLWKKLAANEDKLIDRAWAASLDALGSFLQEAKGKIEVDGSDLADRLWAALSLNDDKLAKAGYLSDLSNLVGFARHAPDSVLRNSLRDIEQGHWADYRTTKQLSGCTWLIHHFERVGRHDLASEVIELLLSRKEPKDFDARQGGFQQLAYFLSVIPSDRRPDVENLLDLICNTKWINVAYSWSKAGDIASALRQLAMHQPKAVRQKFVLAPMWMRLLDEIRDVESGDVTRISQIFQYIGGMDLMEKRLYPIQIQRPLQLLMEVGTATVAPNRLGSAALEIQQLQFWIGLWSCIDTVKQEPQADAVHLSESRSLLERRIQDGEKDARNAYEVEVARRLMRWMDHCLKQTPPRFMLPTEDLLH